MGYAISGGPYVFTTFSGASKTAFLDGLRAALEAAAWELIEDTTAYYIWTQATLPNDGRNVVLGGTTYTFRDTILDSRAGDVLRGSTAAEMMANLAAAVNNAAGAGTLYSSATPIHATLTATETGASTIRLEAKTSGAAGNGITGSAGTAGGSIRATATSALNYTAYGGYKLRGRSPQLAGALTVGLWLYEIGYDYAIALLFSDNDSGILGYPHPLWCSAGVTYQVVANPCQFFLSQPGVAQDHEGSAACGGIPYVTEDRCAEKDAVETTEIWWSMGDGRYSPFGNEIGSSPRVNFLLPESPAYPFSGDGCFNGVFVGVPSGGDYDGVVRILCLTPPHEIEIWPALSHVMFWGDSSVDQDALLAWGDTTSGSSRLRAQIWDSFIDSQALDMDLEIERDGRSWINYTHQYFFGSLFLMTSGPVGGASNYVY